MIAAGGLDTSVATTELNAGVLAAGSAEIRARRLATLDAVSDIVALPVDATTSRLLRERRDLR